MQVTILGCGGSSGVPLIGNVWGRCDPSNPKNRRRRPSILVESGATRVLVDTTPDLREQLIDAGVQYLDGVLFTHAHADHCHGIDDLRAMNWLMRRTLDVWADADTLAQLHARFAYCFQPHPDSEFYARPALRSHRADGPFSIGSLEIEPFVQDHGLSSSLGFRFGRFAYSTDVVRLDEAAFRVLEGVETWIVDCVRIEPPHPVHAHLAITLSWIERLKPKRAILTHMNHMMDYETLRAILPPGVEPGYDGMVIEVGP
ncbi:MBL fold metallo-hydrolase [Rhodocista pekingensis]|uniref:MBL fold metallo-hydrolase n=1 Tax=Rhodocista pekingensis TaxID=201185 RepID=A0ABW2KPX3_9PROT